MALGASFQTATMTFNIEGVSKIVIVDGSNGNTVEITEQGQILELTHTFNANKFTRRQRSINNTGWGYRLSFYHGDTMTSQISIMSNGGIDFEGYFYDIKNGSIDVEYYKELLSDQLIEQLDEQLPDGTHKHVNALPELEESNVPNIVGAWIAATGNAAYFYQDGTGVADGNAGIYEFTWKIYSFDVASKRPREFSVFEYIRILSESAASLGIPWGVDTKNALGPDGWIGEGFILSLIFDGIDNTFDFALALDGEEPLIINTGSLGQSLSPEQDLSARFEWVTLSKSQ